MRYNRMRWYLISAVFVVAIMVFKGDTVVVSAKLKSILPDNQGVGVKKITMIKGKKLKLLAEDESGKKVPVKWFSSDRDIAKVNKNGVVTACKKGSVKISAIDKDDSSKLVCKIVIRNENKPKSVKIKAVTKKCIVGGSITLHTVVYPKNSDNKKIIWKSSNEKVAVVNNGVVKGIKKGKCRITAQINKTKIKKRLLIKVEDVPVSSLSCGYGGNGIVLEYGKKMKLTYKIEPYNATDQTVKFSSANSSIVSVTAQGEIAAVRPGSTTITIQTKSQSKTTKIPVKVTANNGLLTKGMLDKFDFTCIDKLMVVAHPDDESIWGGGHLAEDDYFVLCLTNSYTNIRATDFNKALSSFNDKGIILGYPDLENGKRSDWKSVQTGILKDLSLVLNYKDWELVVTHNPNGEYGHQHHKMTSKYVTLAYNKLDPNKRAKLFYFGKFYEAKDVKTVLANAPQLSKDILVKKNKVLAMYDNQKSIINILSHMRPYENWCEMIDWK